jgi:hypothetical protein
MRYVNGGGYLANNTITELSLAQVFELAPEMSNKIHKLYPKLTNSFLTAGYGKIIDPKKAGDKKVQYINDNVFRWKVEKNDIHSVRINTTFDVNSKPGINNSFFDMNFDEDYYRPNEIVNLDMSTRIIIHTQPEFQSAGDYKYRVSLQTGNKDAYLNPVKFTKGWETTLGGSIHPELSVRGWHKIESHQAYMNCMTVQRKSMTVSGHANMRKIRNMIEGGVKFWVEEEEAKMMERMLFEKEYEFIFGRRTFDQFGNCVVKDPQGNLLWAGDGILQQAHASCRQYYTKFSLNMIREAVIQMSIDCPQDADQGMKKLIFQGGKQVIMDAQAELASLVGNNHPTIASRTGDEVKIGANYVGYIIGDTEVIFTHNSVFDSPTMPSDTDPTTGRKLSSSMGILVDYSMYDGDPNISMMAADERSLVTEHINGMTKARGSKGPAVTSVDGYEYHLLSHGGGKLLHDKSIYTFEKKLI